MRDAITHYATPLFLLVFAAGLLIFAHRSGDADLKSFAIGVGGAGLTLLTAAARTQVSNKISGGPVNIDQTPPVGPADSEAGN